MRLRKPKKPSLITSADGGGKKIKGTVGCSLGEQRILICHYCTSFLALLVDLFGIYRSRCFVLFNSCSVDLWSLDESLGILIPEGMWFTKWQRGIVIRHVHFLPVGIAYCFRSFGNRTWKWRAWVALQRSREVSLNRAPLGPRSCTWIVIGLSAQMLMLELKTCFGYFLSLVPVFTTSRTS